MIAVGLTVALAMTLLWIIYDDLVDKLILGEYQSVIVPLIGLVFFCDAAFKLMSSV